jgi:hypothetical protein
MPIVDRWKKYWFTAHGLVHLPKQHWTEKPETKQGFQLLKKVYCKLPQATIMAMFQIAKKLLITEPEYGEYR